MTPINKAFGSFSALMLFLLVFFYFDYVSNTEEEPVHYIPKIVQVQRDIPIKHYFEYVDSIVHKYYQKNSLELSEHILVRFNPWIIDALSNTNYYKMI